MNVKMEKPGKNMVELEITVDAKKLSEALKKSYNKNVKKFNVPGFRKGKAPIGILKQYYGIEVLYEDAINFCCEDTYPKAIEENNLEVVDYPDIDIVQLEEGKDFIYTAKVVVKPEVELGEYKGLEIKKTKHEIDEEEVQKQLKAMQEKNARLEVKEEGKVEDGNIAIIDFKGFIDGEVFEGGEGKEYPLEIGSGTFIGDFEQQLIGTAIGESKNINVDFPENYGNEDLNGKPTTFEVTVNEIKVKELPNLDDEFAKEVSEFDTLEELTKDIEAKLAEDNKLKEKREFEEAVIEAVCANTTIDIPEVMIKKEIDQMMKDLEMRLQYQGLDLETYYSYTNNTEEKMRDFMKENAEKKVRTDLVLQKISEVEKIEATEEEIREKAMQVASQYGDKEIEKTADLIVSAQGELLKSDVIISKTLDFIVESSKAIEE
ncbi:trigger factor [Clostridium algidicarnis]|uniref:trigger factor n=1 Tax=Clostridium algidicarnis TaxID=37659 RepID=UPI001C0E09B1|nr:trigger factor [Clostridium algidicarnis]MBU3196142.1 trigger factor [Clostridium algidicarnis]MBU3209184.1 trigger factor [Clostridium algidicarnis]MBU3229156.1 trigger factor [Clostridium algidicarnis]MBU3252670.1 trigger factor [Clostridium algidicarnis]